MRVLAAVLVTGLSLGALGTEARASGTRGVPAFWQRLADCETGGRWDWGSKHRPHEGHVYEGGLGFYWGTWKLWASHLKLYGIYRHAYLAPPAVQVRVARYGLAHGGYWGCFH